MKKTWTEILLNPYSYVTISNYQFLQTVKINAWNHWSEKIVYYTTLKNTTFYKASFNIKSSTLTLWKTVKLKKQSNIIILHAKNIVTLKKANPANTKNYSNNRPEIHRIKNKNNNPAFLIDQAF